MTTRRNGHGQAHVPPTDPADQPTQLSSVGQLGEIPMMRLETRPRSRSEQRRTSQRHNDSDQDRYTDRYGDRYGDVRYTSHGASRSRLNLVGNDSQDFFSPKTDYRSTPRQRSTSRLDNYSPYDYYGSPEFSNATHKFQSLDTPEDHGEARHRRRRRSRKSVPIDTLDPEGVSLLSERLSRHRSSRNASRNRSASNAQPPVMEAGTSQTLPPTTEMNLRDTMEDEAVGDGEKTDEAMKQLTIDPFDDHNKFDLGQMLREMHAEADQRGNPRRTMGIAFRDLTVTGTGSGAELNQTFGSVMTSPIRIWPAIRSMMHPPIKTIIENFEGCVKPGEMLLVLGRPGSGCTSLLKSLCSYRDGFRTIDGTVLYEGLDHRGIDGPLRGDVVYSPEDDVHFSTLTVGQTLNFAAATRAPSTKYRITPPDAAEGRKQYIDYTREVLATILGLRHTYNTKVGNDMVRGVSGGERKRVSIAETLATRAKIVMFDNSSRGLDSSTALEFVTALRISTDISLTTTLASIYQAGENITQLFDKVVVLNQGRMAYFGPLMYAVDHFRSIGFEPLDRQTTADFLVACTDYRGQNINPNFRGPVARLPHEQAEAFRESRIGRANRAEVENYIAVMMSRQTRQNADMYVDLARDERANHTRKGSKYLLSWPMQVRLALKRRYQVALGDMGTHLTVMLAALFQALIIGSVFYQMPQNTSGFFSRGGVLFFSLLYNSFTGMSEISLGYEQRPIVIRQKRFAMLHPSADALGNTLLDFPIRMISLVIFDVVVYFLTGLSYDAGKFFTYFGVTCLVTYCMTAFFRMLAASTKSEPLATMFGGVAVLDVALYTGYMIPRGSMKPWWRWLSFCNPVAFGFEILLANEYRGQRYRCQQLVPYGSGFDSQPVANKVCPVAGAQPGNEYVDAPTYLMQTYGFTWDNALRDAMIVLGFWVFFLILYLLSSERQIDPSASGGTMLYNRSNASKNVVKVADMDDIEVQDSKVIAENAEAHVQQQQIDNTPHPSQIKVSESIFSWENINYDVMIKGNPRRLLNDVSGFVAPGKMTALMGESGAGKTTLLNVLAQRTDVGVVRGGFFVNGQPLPRSFQADTGYCQQQDVHLAQSTVREALQFSALLRQPRETPRAEKIAYVETVIELLEMQSFADALVGEVAEGLNVEQRKRLTIGVELAAKPSLLLFLDEPTSGLDAQAAWSIVRFLKKLASEGQAILCTIHQPSGELFNQFDRLLLLQKGGKTVYFGDTGPNSMTLIRYFEERSGVKCDENANPAEYILDVIGAGATATTKHNWHELFLQSAEFNSMKQQLAEVHRSNRAISSMDTRKNSTSQREYAQPFFVQLSVVTRRAFISYWRNPLYLITKMILNVVSGLVVGSSFWKQGYESSKIALQNRLFACFLALVASTSLSQHLQPEFIRFRSLFEVREKPSKSYSWPVMVLSALLVEIPWNFLGGTLYWLPWYWLIQFPSNSQRSAYSWGLYMLFQLYYCTFAQAMAAISPNAMIASILFSTFFSFVVIFCGVVQPPDLLPSFWRAWMYLVSPFFWIMEGMLGNAVGGVDVHCLDEEMQQINPPAQQTCAQYMQGFSSPQGDPAGGTGYFKQQSDGSCLYCQYRRGDDYLATVRMHASGKYRDLGITLAYIAFNTALLFGLFYLFRIHKWKSMRASKTNASGGLRDESESGPVTVPAMQSEMPAMVLGPPHGAGLGWAGRRNADDSGGEDGMGGNDDQYTSPQFMPYSPSNFGDQDTKRGNQDPSTMNISPSFSHQFQPTPNRQNSDVYLTPDSEMVQAPLDRQGERMAASGDMNAADRSDPRKRRSRRNSGPRNVPTSINKPLPNKRRSSSGRHRYDDREIMDESQRWDDRQNERSYERRSGRHADRSTERVNDHRYTDAYGDRQPDRNDRLSSQRRPHPSRVSRAMSGLSYYYDDEADVSGPYHEAQ
ncbi:hypothetical protein MYAM1_002870 [Malassezia yamatoensis]|uniref:ABC transporter domain-containing protein n=1 Tax=Malassezia yamatoensis TaxID=253288 RepID=A0AAJ6CIS7_9BASI|nr:hypothetical protein MYAM1_002870 [Malassezia yamatoensis]